MIRSMIYVTVALVALIGLAAFDMVKGAVTGGTEAHYSVTTSMPDFYRLTAKTLDGQTFEFSSLKGKRVLIVNTASRCGYTPQYKKLQALHEAHAGDDFVILGFPCNQFGRQEPGSAGEISEFCTKNYGVEFQMMEKVDVKGDNQHPVYGWLCDAKSNGVGNHDVGWNFHKFLVDGEGHLISSLKSGANPMGDQIVAFAQGK